MEQRPEADKKGPEDRRIQKNETSAFHQLRAAAAERALSGGRDMKALIIAPLGSFDGADGTELQGLQGKAQCRCDGESSQVGNPRGARV